MKEINTTNNFIPKSDYMEGMQKPIRTIYKLEDCLMAQNLKSTKDTKKSIQKVLDSIDAKEFIRATEYKNKYDFQEVPVLTYEEYLINMKNFIQGKEELKRFRNRLGDLVLTGAIITNYDNEMVAIVERFQRGKYIQTDVFNFEEVYNMIKDI